MTSQPTSPFAALKLKISSLFFRGGKSQEACPRNPKSRSQTRRSPRPLSSIPPRKSSYRMPLDGYDYDADGEVEAEAEERRRTREQRYEDERMEVTADSEAKRAELHWFSISVRDFQVEADARKAAEEEMGGSEAVENWLDNEEREAEERDGEDKTFVGDGAVEHGDVVRQKLHIVVDSQEQDLSERAIIKESLVEEREVSRKRQRSEPFEQVNEGSKRPL